MGTSENKKTQAFRLIYWCKKNKIPSFGLIDSNINSEYRFRGTSRKALQHAPEYLVVPENKTKKEFLKLGFNPKKIRTLDPYLLHKILIYSKKNMDRNISIPQKAFVVTYASEPKTGLNFKNLKKTKYYLFKGRGNCKYGSSIGMSEFITALKKIKQKLKKPVFSILRLHPKEKAYLYRHIKNNFDLVSQKESPNSILMVSNLVVGLTSMFLQEAVTRQIPTISIKIHKKEKNLFFSFLSKKIMIADSQKKLQCLLYKKIQNKVSQNKKNAPYSIKKYLKIFNEN